ncbi:hypothetical protein CCR96_24105 [Halochromatium roseum]|nr:hypothetical protein [Halochromatium roseum]
MLKLRGRARALAALVRRAVERDSERTAWALARFYRTMADLASSHSGGVRLVARHPCIPFCINRSADHSSRR